MEHSADFKGLISRNSSRQCSFHSTQPGRAISQRYCLNGWKIMRNGPRLIFYIEIVYTTFRSPNFSLYPVTMKLEQSTDENGWVITWHTPFALLEHGLDSLNNTGVGFGNIVGLRTRQSETQLGKETTAPSIDRKDELPQCQQGSAGVSSTQIRS